MTVTTSYAPTVGAGDGANKRFLIGFSFADAAHLKVKVDGVLKAVGLDYSVAGSEVVFVVAPAVAARVEIARVTPRRQARAFPNPDSVVPKSIEGMGDDTVHQLQETAELADRALTVPAGEAGLELPKAAARAGAVLAFGADGKLDTSKTVEQIARDAGAMVGEAALDLVEEEGTAQVARVLAEGETQDGRVLGVGNAQDARVVGVGNAQDARVVATGDAQYARVTAEGNAQVANVAAASAAEFYADTATGLAATAEGGFFVVGASGAFSVYRKVSAVAVLQGELAGAGRLAAIKSLLSVDSSQFIGRPTDPVDGSASSDATFIFADPVVDGGALESVRLFAKAAGTITLAKYSKAGTTLTRTGSVTVAIGSTGLKTLTAADFGTFTVASGEYLGISGTGLFTYTGGVAADGTGWWQIGTGAPASGSAATLVTNTRLEVQFRLPYQDQVVTAAALAALQEQADETAEALEVTATQTLGRPVAPIDGTGIFGSMYVLAEPVAQACTLASLKIFAKATGTLTLSKYSKAGSTLTRTGSVSIPLVTTGPVTLTPDDFGTFSLAAGEYIGLGGTGLYTYSNNPADGSGWWGAGTGTTTATGTLNTGSRLEVQYNFDYPARLVSGPVFQSLQRDVAAGGPRVLNLSNVDKIAVVSNSYHEAAGNLLGKSPSAVLSSMSEYNFANYSKGGQTMAQLASLIAAGTTLYGAAFASLGARYALICENQNSKITAGQSDAVYYADTQKLIDIVRGLGATPILATEWGGGSVTTVDGEQRNVRGMRAIAEANRIPFIDGTSKARSMNPSVYAPFWKSGHPATRVSWLVVDGLRRGLKQLPRPKRSLKLFRVRGTVAVSSVADLAFRTVQERHRLFRELRLGQMALSEAQKVNYDVATSLYAGNQTQNDEYVGLAAGAATSFGTYALIDAVLPVTGATGVTLEISDTSCTVYARKMTGTGVSWVALTLVDGVFVVPDGGGFVDEDRIAFLVYKAAGVSLNASPEVAWTAGREKDTLAPAPLPRPTGAELLTQPLTVVGGAVPAQWTNAGALPVVTPADGITPVGTTGCVEVTSSAGLAQAVAYASSDDPVEVVVRVQARRWVAPFDPAGDFSAAPITYETCDTGTLQVTMCGASGIGAASAVLKEQVGLHWCEVEFRETLPALTTAATLDIRSADVPLQIAKVSVRAV